MLAVPHTLPEFGRMFPDEQAIAYLAQYASTVDGGSVVGCCAL